MCKFIGLAFEVKTYGSNLPIITSPGSCTKGRQCAALQARPSGHIKKRKLYTSMKQFFIKKPEMYPSFLRAQRPSQAIQAIAKAKVAALKLSQTGKGDADNIIVMHTDCTETQKPYCFLSRSYCGIPAANRQNLTYEIFINTTCRRHTYMHHDISSPHSSGG